VIPTRTASPKENVKKSAYTKTQARQHDPSALSPSMAALLAMTSIPRSRARAIKDSKKDRLSPSDFRQSVSSTSPHSWSILQSPPDIDSDKDAEFDIEIGSITSLDTVEAEQEIMIRSLSSDSMPSLDADGEMYTSPRSVSMPRTPSLRRAKSPRREKAKLLSTSEPLADGESHPLALSAVFERTESQDDDSISDASDDAQALQVVRSRSRQPSQFRSNLTASLQRLTKAARSISLPTPSVPTVLAINSRVLSEGTPQAEHRRVLPMNNPAFSKKTSHHLSREEKTRQHLASDLYFSSTPSEEYRPIVSSIQLQAYLRRDPDDDPLIDKATAPPVFLSSTPAPPMLLPGVDHPRPREPRENSDFLRVIVLEMNMRRAGKLGDVSGRARTWIGPRSDKSKTEKLEAATKKTGKVTRAQRGMGEVVASELAETMMVDGDEATMARSLQTDDESKAFDADVHEQAWKRTKQSYSKGEVPSRWESVLP